MKKKWKEIKQEIRNLEVRAKERRKISVKKNKK